MKSNDFRVSIIITSYNLKHYLIEAIESVIHQTVRPHEIIIADDHSTDGSVELIRDYIARYPGWIKGVFQKENVGISKNRNAALRQATGNYVAILDGDDRFLSHNVELQLTALAEQPEAGCVYSNLYYINAQGIRTQIRDKALRPSGDIFAYIAVGKVGLLRSMLIRYDLMQRAGFLDERFPKHDGFILTLRLAKYSKFTYVLEPLAEYRVHEKGDSKSLSTRERLHYLEDVFLEVLKLAEDLPPQEIQWIKTVWFWKLLRWRVLADVEQGKRMKALSHIARGFIRNPGRVRNAWDLVRQVF